MANFLKYFLFFLITFEFSFDFADNQQNSFNFFLIFTIMYIYNNFFNFKKDNRLDLDIFFKYILLIFKTPNFLVNYIINVFKKVYIFIVFFKYRNLINTVRIFLRKYFTSTFLWWRPLFKKTSYFGYYRSNRSKWIK